MPRPIQAVIHLEALAHNLKIVRASAPESQVFAVVKEIGRAHV